MERRSLPPAMVAALPDHAVKRLEFLGAFHAYLRTCSDREEALDETISTINAVKAMYSLYFG